jgi:hypothetical protein
MRDRLIPEGTIDSADIDRMLITDDIEKAVQEITRVGMHRFGLSYGPKIKRRWFLWE